VVFISGDALIIVIIIVIQSSMAVIVIVIAWLIVEDVIIQTILFLKLSFSFERLVLVGIWVVATLDEIVDWSIGWLILKLML